MKRKNQCTSFCTIIGAIAASVCLLQADTVVPVTGVTGHDGGNWPASLGHLTDMLNGNGSNDFGSADHNPGMDISADPTDPSTWLYAGNSWPQEWKANSRLDSGTSTNAKIGWAALDLGSVTADLQNLYLWNVRSQNSTENTATYNVYHADAPTVPLPAMPNSKSTTGDYDFSSGGWTLLNGGGALNLPVNTANNNTPQGTLALGGISARYIGIEILTAGGTANRVGLAQVEVTQTSSDVDPPTLAGSDIVDDQGGGPVTVGTLVTYTVTFSEDMNQSTVTSDDFDNAGSSEINIGVITRTAPGVFTVQVTPTTAGSLQLQVPVSASMTDLAGNPLDNDPAIADDTTLTVTADTTAPTLAPADIVDDQGGLPIPVGQQVIYTVTFSEEMDPATVTPADFDNAGTAAATVGVVIEESPGVFSIDLTPTTDGTLQLVVPSGAVLTDLAGNPLDTTSAIADDTIISVDSTAPTLSPADIVDDQGGGPVLENTTVTYTVTFSEDMDAGTVGSDDFSNAGSAPITIGAISETSPGVFSVQITPTTDGTLQLQVPGGAAISDAAGNALDTASAIVDDTTITVEVNTIVSAPVAVAAVSGHDGGNWPATLGHLTDMVNGLNPGLIATADTNPGMDTSADPSDPSTWTYAGNSWPQEWKANSRLDPVGDPGNEIPPSSTNGKIGWAMLDLGSAVADLQNMYLWNVRSQHNTENVATYNVYYANSPTVPMPATPNSKTNIGDYDFASGGWTLLNGGGPLSLAQNNANNNTPQGNVSLGGISARYIGIEILSAGGTANRVGLAQVEITAVDTPGGNDFSDWIAGYSVGGQTAIGDDPDGDGVDNGVENFFGTAPDEFSQGLAPGVVDTGAGTFIFTHPQGTLADDLTAAYRWSKDLQAFNADGASDGTNTVAFSAQADTPSPGTTTVTATVTAGPVPAVLFVDVEVTQP